MKRCLLAELSWRTRRQHSQELRQGLESPRAHPCMITAAASKKKKRNDKERPVSIPRTCCGLGWYLGSGPQPVFPEQGAAAVELGCSSPGLIAV